MESREAPVALPLHESQVIDPILFQDAIIPCTLHFRLRCNVENIQKYIILPKEINMDYDIIVD